MPALLHRGARGCNAQAVALAGLRAGDDAIDPEAAHEDARPEQDHDDGEHDRETRAAANDHHYPARRLTIAPAPASTLYEEFRPYGTTSYRAMRSGLDATANRFRFTGVEKDEETGLAQHGARYYAAWLGRWTTGDPIGVAGGINLYAYAANAPIQLVDRTGYEPCAPDDLTCESDGDDYASDLGTGMTDAEEAELGGSTIAVFLAGYRANVARP